jgi:hypothetical protein
MKTGNRDVDRQSCNRRKDIGRQKWKTISEVSGMQNWRPSSEDGGIRTENKL